MKVLKKLTSPILRDEQHMARQPNVIISGLRFFSVIRDRVEIPPS